MKVISQWTEGNSGFTVNIWVDSKTAGRSFGELEDEYRKMFKSEGVDVISASEVEDYKGENAPIVIQDIDKVSREGPVAFEIDQLRPNYGASSDMLRYYILYIHGGAYFDSDVAPNPEQRLKSTEIFGAALGHILYIDHVSQKQNPRKETLLKFSLQFLGNDTFICSKGNPLMKQILIQVKSKYYCTSETPNKVRHSIAHLSRDMREITIGRTGPVHVTGVIGSYRPTLSGDDAQLTVDKEKIMLCRVRNGKDREEGGLELTKPMPNTRNWLKIKVLDCEESHKKAYNLALDAIKSEVKSVGVLRLDDHILYLSKSLNEQPSIVANELISLLKSTSLLRAQNLFVQLTFEYPESEKLVHALTNVEGSTCSSVMNLNSDETTYIVEIQTACQALKKALFDSLKYLELNYPQIDSE